MNVVPDLERLRRRQAPLAMAPDEFREIGHRLVDQIADRLAKIPAGLVTPNESAADVRTVLGAEQTLPVHGADAGRLISDVTEMLFDHSLFNGHPRFWGYITSSPAPIGMFADFVAAALNQNVGAWRLAPLATEIERQAVRWIAELIGFPSGGGGLLVSGGNAANFACFVAARAATAGWDVRKDGLRRDRPRLLVYAATETHGWIKKAADLFGLGTDAIRWIATDDRQRMDASALRRRIEQDLEAGDQPFLVVGNAGSVSTGAVDPLPEIAAICREHRLWFHVDGAYGALAAQAPGSPASLRGLSEADSVAVDPHKWLYAPLEAGCVLVRDPGRLRAAFSYHADYYHFDDQAVNFFDYGPQNSRGFRALKVWLALRQAGGAGYLKMIGDDMLLAKHLHQLLAGHPDFEATTQGLSITTFRYVPADLRPQLGSEPIETYLNQLNQHLLTAVENSGEAFLSNAAIGGMFVLRACIVNFHTSLEDIEALPSLLSRLGRAADAALRPAPVAPAPANSCSKTSPSGSAITTGPPAQTPRNPREMKTMTTNMTPEMSQLKTRLKATWEAGDYGVFAKYLEPGALQFFDRLNIAPGTRLLDVGCGAGQLTLPAARRGIKVTALDLAANLVDQARAKAAAEGLQVQVDQGDAEALPYPTASFDVVMSLIGSMFAPRPELVASEMIRVCVTGGRLIMGNWTPEGHVGQMFKVIGKHVPPPSYFPSPLLWGNEATCRERFGAGVSELEVTRHLYPFEYPFEPEKVAAFFAEYYGPTNRAYASLSDEARKALHADLTELWSRNNLSTDGTTRVESEYITVEARRA